MEGSGGYPLLLKRLGLLMIAYSLCRLLFLIFNLPAFSSHTFAEIISCFFFGLQFDVTAIVITNTPVILLHFLPENIFRKKIIKSVTKILFLLINCVMMVLNAIDFGLFQFTAKRATADVFKVILYGNDFMNTVPKMIADFWYVLLLLFAIWYCFYRFYPEHVSKKFDRIFNNNFSKKITGKLIYLIGFIALYLIGFRGGIQFKPISIITASKYGDSGLTPLILNTPFTFVKTYGKNTLAELKFMSEEKAQSITPVFHKPPPGGFKNKNVVLIVLESFGKEYIGYYNKGKGYTPFLDSLIPHTIDFTNAYANAKRSIEGIPAITAGIPSLLSEPVITSAYSGNTFTSIASLLDKKNYETIFFHGGTNGTMGFDNFTKAIGYKKYFGRNEYNNDTDFDNTWGIYDEPFLHRAADEMTKMSQPFFATIFTLSSHHPYSIPEKYAGKFKEGTLPIHISIRYSDYALKMFFQYASTQPWYNNTLFVITADHTALSEYQYYRNNQGMYAIPLLYFMPGENLSGKNHNTTQQIDILPSVMGILNYDLPYFSFGQNVFDTTKTGYAVTYLNGAYQFIESNYAFITDNNGKNEYYQFFDDTISGQVRPDSAEMHLRLNSFIQNYNSALINNKMQMK